MAQSGEAGGAAALRELLALADRPGMLSFAGGLPAPSLLPVEAVARAAASILSDTVQATAALQYSSPEGYLPLREWVAGHMGRMGVPCSSANVLVTSGSQQALDLLGRLFLEPGGTVLAPALTYLGAIQAFSSASPRYARLDTAGNSTPAAYAEDALAAGSRIGMAYAVPDFSNPTGETMDEVARLRLLDLAEALDVPLVEDGAYSSISFSGGVLPSCLALSAARRGGIDATRIAYCGTFSKVVAPGLRVGWVCASRNLIGRLVPVKQATDFHASCLSQMVVHRVASEDYDRLASQAAAAYGRKRDAMMASLARHMPPEVSWTRPEGGMFAWVTLPEGVDSARLLERAIQEEGISFVPGAAFHPEGGSANALRLSWSFQDEAGIDEGMRRLGRLVRSSSML